MLEMPCLYMFICFAHRTLNFNSQLKCLFYKHENTKLRTTTGIK